MFIDDYGYSIWQNYNNHNPMRHGPLTYEEAKEYIIGKHSCGIVICRSGKKIVGIHSSGHLWKVYYNKQGVYPDGGMADRPGTQVRARAIDGNTSLEDIINKHVPGLTFEDLF